MMLWQLKSSQTHLQPDLVTQFLKIISCSTMQTLQLCLNVKKHRCVDAIIFAHTLEQRLADVILGLVAASLCLQKWPLHRRLAARWAQPHEFATTLANHNTGIITITI